MDTSLFLLRNLKYRALPALVGQQLVIPAFNDIESFLLEKIELTKQADFKLNNRPPDMALTMAKYGLLDLTLATSEPLLTSSDRIGPRTLRELGFSPRPRNSSEEPGVQTKPKGDRDCLEIIQEDIQEDLCLLRLFLTSESPRDSMNRIFAYMKKLPAPREPEDDPLSDAIRAMTATANDIEKRFPVTFTIESACLTNSGSVWIAQHQYL